MPGIKNKQRNTRTGELIDCQSNVVHQMLKRSPHAMRPIACIRIQT